MAKTATLTDAFAGTVLSGNWYTFTGTQESVSNSAIVTHPSASATYAGFTSQVTYDATSSYVLSWLTSAGNQSLVSLEIYPVQLFLGGGANSNSQVSFYLNQNNLSAAYDTGAGLQEKNTVTYNPALHKYFMIAEASGVTTWSTSADGQHFTVFYALADPITLTAVTVQIFGGTYASESTGTVFTWRDVGIYGPAGPPRLFAQAVKRTAHF